MKLTTLYSRSTKGKINEHVIEVEGNKYRTISGFTDGKKTTTKWKICSAKSYCTAEEQALKEAKAMHRKKIERGAFENVKDIDSETYFEPMLAEDWDKLKKKPPFPLFSQPKLDGIRCIVQMRGDGMWSRTGKKIVSAPHIYEQMKHLFVDNPDLIFDGELYADKFANDFNAICSLVKKTKPTPEDLVESASKIEYHIYDLPSCNDVFSVRSTKLSEIDLPECCKLVPTYKLVCENDIHKQHELYVEEGYEGQILRVDEKYENKRSKYLIKHKSFIDEEYTILGVEEGVGNKQGMVGKFLFQNKNGKLFKASPKFNWEECTKMWINKSELIGKLATVKYFNLTPDGVPRFGYVIKIAREDYE
jgi:DNA ligase 1